MTTNHDLLSFSKKKASLQDKIKTIAKEYWYLSLAFLIPAVIMYLIYLSMEIHPFGEGSVLVLDLNGQYVSFFMALRNFVYGDASLLYSFGRALGGEFMGMYAYYLASPFSYIVALFPKDKILEALLLIFILKTGFCGFSFGFYLHKTTKDHKRFNKVAIVGFSMLYALSAYCVIYQHNSMWIDAVIWLPLITYGIEELIKKGRYKLYIISLAISIMSNFYIGWMTCIYCAAYFFVYYFMQNENRKNNPYREKAHFAKSFLRMGLFSLIAVAISAVIILASYYSLSFGKDTFSNTNWGLSMRFDILDLIVKFLHSSYDTVRPEGLPLVYCGVSTLILVPVFFCSSRFSLREKILSGAFILFFLLSFVISPVDIFWHGFQKPNWLNYRYSFMLCFFLLVIAYKGLLEIKRTSSKTLLFISGALVLIAGIVQKLDLSTFILDNRVEKNGNLVWEDKTIVRWQEGKAMTIECIWLTVIAILAYLIILGVIKRSNKQRNISFILVAVISLELFANGLICCLSLGEDVIYTSHTSYHNNIDPLFSTVEEIKKSDSSFYRLEEIYHRKANDNIALNVYGMTSSTSTLNATTIRFLANMGYMGKSHESRYYAGNVVADSLLNVKYVLAGENDTAAEYKADKELLYDESLYSLYFSDPNYEVYENLYSLSLAYAVSKDIKDVDLSEYHNPYERLNAIITKMLGEDTTVEVFKPLKGQTVNLTNVTGKYTPVNNTNYDYPFTAYTTVDTEKSAYLKYTVTLPESEEDQLYTYFYLPSEFQREFTFTAPSGSYGAVYGGGSQRSLFVGSVDSGDSVSVTLKLGSANVLYVTENVPLFYYLDTNVYSDVMEKLSESLFNVEEGFSDDHLNGTINTKNDNSAIFTSIPYDAGWIVKVDGKKIDTYGILGDSSLEATKSEDGALLAFDIDKAGEHTVELIYRPKPIVLGLIISVIGIITFIFLIVFEKFFNKIGEKILFPLTVPVTFPKEEKEIIDENGKKTFLIPPATEGETPRGLEPAIPLRAMNFEKAEPIETHAPQQETDKNNGETD